MTETQITHILLSSDKCIKTDISSDIQLAMCYTVTESLMVVRYPHILYSRTSYNFNYYRNSCPVKRLFIEIFLIS